MVHDCSVTNVHQMWLNEWENELCLKLMNKDLSFSFDELMKKALRLFYNDFDIIKHGSIKFVFPINAFKTRSKNTKQFNKKFVCGDELDNKITQMLDELEIKLRDLCVLALMYYDTVYYNGEGAI